MSYLNVLISILGLSFIIFFHELGHFFFCRLFGVCVEIFSVGFGSSIFSYRDKYNTEWVLSFLPIGGYILPLESVKNLSDEKRRGLNGQIGTDENHPLKNVLIAFAGPLFNFILSFLIIFALNLVVGSYEMKYEISRVQPASVAEFHDFRKGDFIIDVTTNENGLVVKGIKNAKFKDGSVVTISRNNCVIQKKISLDEGQSFQGLGFIYSYNKPKRLINCIVDAFKKVLILIYLTFYSLFMALQAMFLKLMGRANTHVTLSGTIGAVNVIKDALKNGWADFLIILAQISISMGAFNLLPIPTLDGGHILIGLIEWVIGRKLNMKIKKVLMIISLMLMVIVFIVATFSDLIALNKTK